MPLWRARLLFLGEEGGVLGPNREFGSFARKFSRKECFQPLVATYPNKTLSAPPSTEEALGGHSGTLTIISQDSSVAPRLAMTPTATPTVYRALTGRWPLDMHYVL